ncbi:DUF4864 domain-containing protein [Faunimonas pinastri]|nr:DUF4864 domain-containing protein [Faunimonas pinastri]
MPTNTDADSIRTAVEVFVWGVSNNNAKAVYALAPRAEQKRYGSEQAVLTAFSASHPPLAYAQQLTFDSITQSRGQTSASFYIKDKQGLQWHASFGMTQDNAGAWHIANCAIEAAPGTLI